MKVTIRKPFSLFILIALLTFTISFSSTQPIQAMVTADQFPYFKHIVAINYPSPQALAAADLDGDGDMDVISAAAGDTDEFAWWENDGEQHFTHHFLASGVYPHDVLAIDLDGDTDVDIITADLTDEAPALHWWENDSTGAFTQHDIDPTFVHPYCLFVIDIDGDSDLDLVVGSSYNNDFHWLENDGAQSFSRHVLDFNYYAYGAYATDVDGDSDIDILAASRSTDDVRWWENDGTPAIGTWTKHTVSTSHEGAMDVQTTDLDMDGDQDVIAASYNDGIAWWENDGAGAFTLHNLIYSVSYTDDFDIGDLDNDGDLDIAWDDSGHDIIGWWQNNGDRTFTRINTVTNYPGANSVVVVDMDSDGDADLLGDSFSLGEIAWWEQAPPPTFAYLPAVQNQLRPPDGAPVLNPIDNADGDFSFVVSWNAIGNATDYVLELDDNMDFSSPSIAYTGALTETTESTGNGTWYLRVKATNTAGESPWSNIESVQVTATCLPDAGYWSGSNIHFNVSTSCRVSGLSISYIAYCHSGDIVSMTTQFSTTDLIENNQFSISWVDGAFTSAAQANGSYVHSFFDPLYGNCTTDGTWSATNPP